MTELELTKKIEDVVKASLPTEEERTQGIKDAVVQALKEVSPGTTEAYSNPTLQQDKKEFAQIMSTVDRELEYKGFLEFLLDIASIKNGGQPSKKLLHSQKIARTLYGIKTTGHFAENDDSQGGFLVPEVYKAELLQVSLESSIVRPRATVIPMTTDSLKIPVIKQSSHTSHVYGGVICYWTEEAGTISPTKADFGQVNLNPKKLAGLTYVSNELISDSVISLEALIKTLFGNAIGWFEDLAFIAGTGSGQPLGIINSGALVTVAKEDAQSEAILYKNLAKMYSRMLPASLNKAVWLCNPNILPELLDLSLSFGTGGNIIWVNPNGGAAQAPPMTIFGRPIIWTEKCSALGTKGDILFADLSQYLVGDRQALRIDMSTDAAFTTDEVAWRFVIRVDGAPWMVDPLTLKNGSETYSAFIALADR